MDSLHIPTEVEITLSPMTPCNVPQYSTAHRANDTAPPSSSSSSSHPVEKNEEAARSELVSHHSRTSSMCSTTTTTTSSSSSNSSFDRSHASTYISDGGALPLSEPLPSSPTARGPSSNSFYNPHLSLLQSLPEYPASLDMNILSGDDRSYMDCDLGPGVEENTEASVQETFLTSERLYIASLRTLLTAYLIPLSNATMCNAQGVDNSSFTTADETMSNCPRGGAEKNRFQWPWDRNESFGQQHRSQSATEAEKVSTPTPPTPADGEVSDTIKDRWRRFIQRKEKGGKKKKKKDTENAEDSKADINPLQSQNLFALLETFGSDVLKMIACHTALENEMYDGSRGMLLSPGLRQRENHGTWNVTDGARHELRAQAQIQAKVLGAHDNDASGAPAGSSFFGNRSFIEENGAWVAPYLEPATSSTTLRKEPKDNTVTATAAAEAPHNNHDDDHHYPNTKFHTVTSRREKRNSMNLDILGSSSSSEDVDEEYLAHTYSYFSAAKRRTAPSSFPNLTRARLPAVLRTADSPAKQVVAAASASTSGIERKWSPPPPPQPSQEHHIEWKSLTRPSRVNMQRKQSIASMARSFDTAATDAGGADTQNTFVHMPFPLALLKMVPLMRLAYHDFIVHFQRNVSMVDAARRSVTASLWPGNYVDLARSVFVEELRLSGMTDEAELAELTASVDVSFESLVTLPIQRLTRYPLLLSEWMKRDAADHYPLRTRLSKQRMRNPQHTSGSQRNLDSFRRQPHTSTLDEADEWMVLDGKTLYWSDVEKAALEAYEAIENICANVNDAQATLNNVDCLIRVAETYGVYNVTSNPHRRYINDGYFTIRKTRRHAASQANSTCNSLFSTPLVPSTTRGSPTVDVPGAALLFNDCCMFVEYDSDDCTAVKHMQVVPMHAIQSVRLLSGLNISPPAASFRDAMENEDMAGVLLSYSVPVKSKKAAIAACFTDTKTQENKRLSTTFHGDSDSTVTWYHPKMVEKTIALIGNNEADVILWVRDLTAAIDSFYGEHALEETPKNSAPNTVREHSPRDLNLDHDVEDKWGAPQPIYM